VKDVVKFGVSTPGFRNKHKAMIFLKKLFSENITTITIFFKISY